VRAYRCTDLEPRSKYALQTAACGLGSIVVVVVVIVIVVAVVAPWPAVAPWILVIVAVAVVVIACVVIICISVVLLGAADRKLGNVSLTAALPTFNVESNFCQITDVPASLCPCLEMIGNCDGT